MKQLKKITVHNAEDVLSKVEMKVLMGGYDGVAQGCSDHSTPEECFGSCTEIIGESLRTGECKWVVVSAINYAGCACVISGS